MNILDKSTEINDENLKNLFYNAFDKIPKSRKYVFNNDNLILQNMLKNVVKSSM